MEAKTLQAARAKVETLDLSAENTAIERHQSELENIEAALARGQARIADIAGTLANWSGPNARAVAAALLGNDEFNALAANAPSRETLIEEREALAAGMRELRQRADIVRDEITGQEQRIVRCAADALAPLTDALVEDARRAARTILEAYAAIYAINRSTKGAISAFYALREPVKALAKGADSLLPYQPKMEVPEEARAILALMVGKSPSLHNLTAGAVPMP